MAESMPFRRTTLEIPAGLSGTAEAVPFRRGFGRTCSGTAVLSAFYTSPMPFVSLTRLRLRSVRFLPPFALHTMRSLRQIRQAPGFLKGALLPDRQWTFWTLTAWESEESMRAYIISGAHKAAMPKLMHWCDEASVAHWTTGGQHEEDAALPSWDEADRRMRVEGRTSKVNKPSPHHADLTYRAPRTTLGGRIRPRSS